MVHELQTANVSTKPPQIMVPRRIYRSQSVMKFRDCTSMNSTENIQRGYRNGLSKTALEFENCKQQLFTLTICLPPFL